MLHFAEVGENNQYNEAATNDSHMNDVEVKSATHSSDHTAQQ